MIVTARKLLIVQMFDCPKDGYPRRYGDHSGDGDRPMNVDCHRYCEFPGIFNVLGKVTVLGLVTIIGMVTIRGKVTILRM